MIGIVCRKEEELIVEEFFQLFKTPWEFCDASRAYEVVLVTGKDIPETDAKCVIIFGCEKHTLDDDYSTNLKHHKTDNLVEYKELVFPILKGFLTFDSNCESLIKIKKSNEIIGIKVCCENEKTIIRVGYDFFQEIDLLLSGGQPVKYALIPTLELHISLLRRLILSVGIPLIEIPPIPSGYDFMVCLTHDVDFVGIRKHKLDRTLFGFLYRAIVRTPIDVVKGRVSWRKMARNFKAVLALPFVHLGIAKDFMVNFERYTVIEKGLRSTFFMMPFKKQEGRDGPERASKGRETQYDVEDIIPEIELLVANGCEIGLHGIDAWCDQDKGSQELERICRITGDATVGVRMHWLFYSMNAPRILEKSGFMYDSTLGYNDAVGYRAGTTQVFLTKDTENLFELPLHLMDTALFYPDRMNLTEKTAYKLCQKLFAVVEKFGGVLTINWHHRSIGPERLWDTFYIMLLHELKKKRVWSGTAKDIVFWFKKRRSVSFERAHSSTNEIDVVMASKNNGTTPELILRICKPIFSENEQIAPEQKCYQDIPFSGKQPFSVSLNTLLTSKLHG